MESIRLRKNLTISEQQSDINSQPPQQSDEDDYDDKDHSKSRIRSPEFKYSQILLLSFLPPLVILLAFGGKPSLITIGFGSIIAYILDLLGTIEGTFSLIVVTMIALWGTLVWAGKLLLLESWINVSILLLFGYFLFFFTVILASQFRSLRYEFDQSLYYYEYFLFASTPLISSTIITWFLCLEISAFQLSYCFSLVYFCYMFVLAQPRKTSLPLSTKYANDPNNQHKCFILKLPVIKVMNIIPIVISPLLTLSIQHNNIFILSWSSLTEIAVSILIPLLLMIICSEQQLNYWPIEQRRDVSMSVSTLKLGIVAVLFACLQDNEIFDDLKAFSNMSDTLASATFCGIAMLATLAVGIYHSETVPLSNQNFLDSGYSSSNNYSIQSQYTVLIKRVIVDICTGGAGLLCGLLLRLPPVALPVAIIGSIALAEYYQRINNSIITTTNSLGVSISSGDGYSSSTSRRQQLKETQLINASIATLAAVSAAATMLTYSMETLYFYTFTFEAYGYSMNIQQFCMLSVIITAMVVLSPMVLYSNKMAAKSTTSHLYDDDDDDNDDEDSDDNSSSGSLLPTSTISTSSYSSGYNNSSGNNNFANDVINSLKSFLKFKWLSTKNAFSVIFPACCMVLSVIELLVREQDWNNHFTSAPLVYPYPLFISTSLLICFTALHLYQQCAIKSWCLWTILIVQGMKLTSLNGVKLTDIFAMGAIFLSYTRPFLVHCLDQEKDRSSSNNSSGSGSISNSSSIFMGAETSNTATSVTDNDHVKGKIKIDDTNGYNNNNSSSSAYSASYNNVNNINNTAFNNNTIASTHTPLNWPLFLMYIGNGAFATNFARNVLAGRFLLFLTAKESGDVQHATASLCLFCAFVTAMLHTFRRKLKTLRSIFIAATILLALLTSDTVNLPFRFTTSFPYVVFDSTGGTGSSGSGINGIDVTADKYEYDFHHQSSYVGLFFIISLLLSLAATTSILSIKKPIARLGYCLFFSVCASRAMHGWAFWAYDDWNNNNNENIDNSNNSNDANNNSNSWFLLPNVFCFIFTFVCTSTVLHASSTYSKKSKMATGDMINTDDSSMYVFIASVITPIVFLFYALIVNGVDEVRNEKIHIGILWSAAVAYGLIGISIRIAAISSKIKKLSLINSASNNSSSKKQQSSITATATSIYNELSSSTTTTSSTSSSYYKDDDNITTVDNISLMTAILGIFWTVVVTQLTHSSSLFSSSSSSTISLFLQDLIVPFSTLYLLSCRYGTISKDTHSLSICLFLCSCWWFLCGFYSVFLHTESDIIDPFEIHSNNYGDYGNYHNNGHNSHSSSGINTFFADGNVSIWTSPTLFMPLLHLVLLLAPLPSIILSFLQIRDQSEEVIFMLAIISFASVLGSQLASIRLLGIAGVVSGFYRSSDISERKRKGHRLI